jgi:hypothetical protein
MEAILVVFSSLAFLSLVGWLYSLLARFLGRVPVGRRFGIPAIIILMTAVSIFLACMKSPTLFVLVAIPLFVLVMLWGLSGLLGSGEHRPDDGTPLDLASLAERDVDLERRERS